MVITQRSLPEVENLDIVRSEIVELMLNEFPETRKLVFRRLKENYRKELEDAI